MNFKVIIWKSVCVCAGVKTAAASLYWFNDYCISCFLAIIVDHIFARLQWAALCVGTRWIFTADKSSSHLSETEPDELCKPHQPHPLEEGCWEEEAPLCLWHGPGGSSAERRNLKAVCVCLCVCGGGSIHQTPGGDSLSFKLCNPDSFHPPCCSEGPRDSSPLLFPHLLSSSLPSQLSFRVVSSPLLFSPRHH